MATRMIGKGFPVVVTQGEPEPGDHIYTYRRQGLYTHHGIYVGEGTVIHLTRTGVNMTCLDCFRREGKKFHSLRSYVYGQPRFTFTRPGTGTMLAATKSPQEVVNKARELLEGGHFGEYDLFSNNCEHFATFCRTEVRTSAQTAWLCAFAEKIKKAKLCALKLPKGLRSSDPNIHGDSGMDRKNLIVERTSAAQQSHQARRTGPASAKSRRLCLGFFLSHIHNKISQLPL